MLLIELVGADLARIRRLARGWWGGRLVETELGFGDLPGGGIVFQRPAG
jgi:hypothetical protein